jgi:methyltransferase (TIGR00027 family)
METERKDALFRDPLAAVLAGEKGKRIADTMKATRRYSYWSLVIRTYLIDELIAQHIQQGYKTIINLGAGLDTRPYRLDLPSDLRWIELDFPSVIDYKNARLRGERPRCRLERRAADLADREQRQTSFNELHLGPEPALVLTEGVIPYLTEEMVSDLGADLSRLPGVQHWIAEYYSPWIYPQFQSEKFKRRLGGAPFRFFPQEWFSVFDRVGWSRKELHYLFDLGEKLKRPVPAPLIARLLTPIIGRSKMTERLRVQGYCVLEKKA